MPDEATPPEPSEHVQLKTLRCRRTGQLYRVEQHVQCPYCSGDADTIRRSGKYQDFCEFHPGSDPVNFGFPPDSDRTRHG